MNYFKTICSEAVRTQFLLALILAALFHSANVSASQLDGTTEGSENLSPPYIDSIAYEPFVSEGDDEAFFVNVYGDEPFHFQWLFNGVVLTGATNQALSITNVSLQNQGSYSVNITNEGGASTSDPVYLTISPSSPRIILAPQPKTVLPGGVTTLTVSARGSGPLTYQWQKDSYNLTGKTSASLRIANRRQSSGSYRVVVSNPLGVVASDNTSFVVTNDYFRFKEHTGGYSGLFYDDRPIYGILRHDTSGFFSLRVVKSGAFSGKLLLDGDQIPFFGKFSTDGIAAIEISRVHFGKDTLTITFDLLLANESDDDRITGSITCDSWTAVDPELRATIQGHHSVFGANNPYKGRYTISCDHVTRDFAGYGFGCVKIRNNGYLTFFGKLVDGTPISQGVPISQAGAWPLYVPLYKTRGDRSPMIPNNRGSLFGWIGINPEPIPTIAPIVEGGIFWRKGTNTPRFFPEVSDFTLSAYGSRYSPPAPGNPVIRLQEGSAYFVERYFQADFSFDANMNEYDHLTIHGLESTIRINRRNGLVSGNSVLPGPSKIKLHGVVQQKINSILGYFLGADITGEITIQPYGIGFNR